VIRRVEHFSFTISNLEDALQFFCDFLGMRATPTREVYGDSVDEILQIPSVRLRVSTVKTPDDADIELMEYVQPKGEKIDSRPCNAGVPHISFIVDDIWRMYRDLADKGVQFFSQPVRIDTSSTTGMSICYLKGPDGINIELKQES
jgi:catechol 2,3-dioxygenase-like lactoylglutathione lyase family enzyme